MTNTSERKGLLFREKPFILAIIYPRMHTAAMRELVYIELLNEDTFYREAFGIEEVGH